MNITSIKLGREGSCRSIRQLNMSIEQIKQADFKEKSLKAWAEKAEESLKGKSIETLSTYTYESIKLKPLYTKEDVDSKELTEFPGVPDFRRGISSLGHTGKGWEIAQTLSFNSIEELNTKLETAIQRGQTAVSFPVGGELFSDISGLKELIKTIGTNHLFSLNAGEYLKPFLAVLISALKESEIDGSATGFIAADPIAQATESGFFPADEETFMGEWEETVRTAVRSFPELRTVLINAAPYHNSGASADQELGIAIASGVQYLHYLIEQGWEVDKALNLFIFHFPVGSQFFMETAKLRAARLLWDKVGESYNGKEQARKMHISAETSFFTKTVYDPYVNMLRTGNEAFAAVLGGVQYLKTSPFNEAYEEPTFFSERVARNTQLLLREEAGLKHVADPAGGSWYVETLTRELAQKGWDFFLEIEEEGGLIAALKSGWLQSRIQTVMDKRKQDISTRKRSIIGTNVYANLDEEIKQATSSEKKSHYCSDSLTTLIQLCGKNQSLEDRLRTTESGDKIVALQQDRLAAPYERLRVKAGRLSDVDGRRPSIGLICIGELKRHKPRADFITGFMSAGGIKTMKSTSIVTKKDALAFIDENPSKYFCLCGDNEQYEEQGIEIVRELNKKHPEIQIYVAGLPPENDRSKWANTQVRNFIHVKSNCLEVLSALLDEMEVSSREGKA